MHESIRLILAGVVRQFVIDEAVKSTHYFREDDLAGDDPVALPPGRIIKVTIWYVDEDEPETE